MASAAAFRALLRAIVADDGGAVRRLLDASPDLATATERHGATRQDATSHVLHAISHYVYAGDTALHVAAAGYRTAIVTQLIATGADVRARNRRGAEPLHYAADGVPDGRGWNPKAQARTIALLIEAGANPDAIDKSGVAPLHRAVRTRCAAAVEALLEGGADAALGNTRGSTPLQLATRTTGRGGSGLAVAKAQQERIKVLLEQHVSR